MAEKIVLLTTLQEVILGLMEIDQEVVTLENYYRAGSREKVMRRYEEIIGTLLQERDKIKALTPDSYIN